MIGSKTIKKHRYLIENYSYLMILEAINILLPLIVLPYLLIVLGKETYGLVVFTQSVIGYLSILVNFGFDLCASRDVSTFRNDKEALNRIICSVYILKLILFFISFFILFVTLNLVTIGRDNELLFYLTMGMCLAEVLMPTWYFQGMEKMKYLTIINTISKGFFAILIFLFIKNKNDFFLVPVVNGIGAIIAGVYGLYIVFIKDKYTFFIPQKSFLLSVFKSSIPLFLSNLSIKLYVSSSKVIIGSFLSMSEVSYYDLAEKVASVLKIPQNMLGRVLLPKISFDKDLKFANRLFKYSLLVNILIYAFSFFAIVPVVQYFGKGELSETIIVGRILFLSVPIICVSNYYGIQLLIPFGFQKEFSKIVVISAFIYAIQFLFILTFGLINLYSISIISVSTEIFVTVGTYYYYREKIKLKYNNF
jgi:O-antigen/teichoic acid export membrane protein